MAETDTQLQDIKKIWQERFNDSRQWMELVFSRIYRPEEALNAQIDSEIVSALLLRRLPYQHLGIETSVAYVYGAATKKRYQGQGLMTSVVFNAIREAASRGDSFIFLKPARNLLFDYYGRRGFSTAVYSDIQRFTAAQMFAHDTSTFESDTTIYDIPAACAAYNRLTHERGSSLLHTSDDFKTILLDNSLDNGYKAIVTDRVTGVIAALAFATEDRDNEVLRISDLTADSEAAAREALATISDQRPGIMKVLHAYPGSRPDIKLTPTGMARIANVDAVMHLLAKADSKLKATITVSDPIVADNNGTWVIDHGEVKRYNKKETASGNAPGYLDTDVTVLTSILFSEPKIGEIFGLPTARPYISLLLD